MALIRRLGTYTLEINGAILTVEGSLSNLQAIADDTGYKNPFEAIAMAQNLVEIATILYHTQVGSAYSKDDIYAFIAGDLKDEGIGQKLNDAISVIVGDKIADKLPPETSSSDTKKKR